MIPENLLTDDGEEHRTAIVVTSCSRYSQVWQPFFLLFGRYWADCPYKVFFISDSEKAMLPDIGGVTNIPFGRDAGWCTNTILALGSLHNFDRVLLFQEDFLLTSKVDTRMVRQLVRYSRDNDVGCLRLCPCPGPDRKWRDPFLGELGPSVPYRVSLQLAIWKPSVLLGLMRHGEAPWIIEFDGCARSAGVKEPFLSLWRQPDDTPGGPVRYFITAVTRGVWEDGALELLRHEGIPMDGITKRIT
jgi:hypothetical protein